MRKIVLLFACALLDFAADDLWAKVKALKSGTELRVYKRGSAQPLVVKMDEATDERLVFVDKKEQTSVAKEEIERIDARPAGKRPVTKETKSTTNEPDPKNPGSTTSGSSTGYSFGSRPDFETVYKRPLGTLKK